MNKFVKNFSISINILSIIGWLNTVIWYYFTKAIFDMKIDLIKDASVTDSIGLTLLFGILINAAFISFFLLLLLFEYFLKVGCNFTPKLSLNLWTEKIKNKLLYKILSYFCKIVFYFGLIFMFLSLFLPFILPKFFI